MNAVALPTRRMTIRAARDRAPAMGVYAARVRGDDYLVLKATRHLDASINRDRFELRLGSHRDRRLQGAWASGKDAAVVFEIVEVLRPRDEPGYNVQDALDCALALWTEELCPQEAKR